MRRDPHLAIACLTGLILGELLSAPAQQRVGVVKGFTDQRFDYRDSHDGRRLADIRVEIVPSEGAQSLRLVVSAVGPRVDSIPGFPGIHGANRYTAEQIESIVMGRYSLVVK